MSERPLRVLIAGDYPPDARLGSAKVSYKLAEELAALGHECDTLFADDIGGPGPRQVRQLVGPWFAARAIARRHAARQYDVLDVASAEGLWIGVARRIGRYGGTAYVSRSHGLEHANYRRMLGDARAGLTRKPWTRRLWYPASRLSQVALAARLSDAMIVINEADREYAIARGWKPPAAVTVVGHGTSPAFQQEFDADAPRGAGLLFCGSWDHTKGVAYLADAMSRLRAAGRRYPLTVLGPGLPPEAVLAAFPPAVRESVTVLPRTTEDRVIAEYRRHDVLIWPSTYEGFGLVLIEAMSQRLPAVAAPAGCAPQVVRDGETGRLVPPRDPAAIAAAVAQLMDDAPLRRRIGDAARRAVLDLTWRATAERTLDVYRAALAAARDVR